MRITRGLVCAALVAGCGGEAGVKASDFEGFWLVSSITYDTPDGDVTTSRDGVAASFRADVDLVAVDDTHATMSMRQAFLLQGVLASPITVSDQDVVVEADGRWVVTGTDAEVTVFTTTLEADHLVLALDAADPRTTAADPFDARLVFDRVMTVTQYSDDACATQVDQQTSTQHGFVEEEGGVVLRMWGAEGDRREFQQFRMSGTGDERTLTRTACLPLPDCEDSAPREVVVRRPT